MIKVLLLWRRAVKVASIEAPMRWVWLQPTTCYKIRIGSRDIIARHISGCIGDFNISKLLVRTMIPIENGICWSHGK
jgi:hypothetical protein